MQEKKLDPSIVFPDRPKNAPLTRRALCPGTGCSVMVKWSEFEDGDEVLAAHCRSYCERDHNKWIDDPLCYAKNFLQEVKIEKKPKSKKKSSYYKNKKKKANKSAKTAAS